MLTPPNAFTQACSQMRTEIKKNGRDILKIITIVAEANFTCTPESDIDEMTANVMMAYRHAEDAAMRLGKAIQAFETGKSIYDDNDSARASGVTPGAAGQVGIVHPDMTGIIPLSDPANPKHVYYGPHHCQRCDATGYRSTKIVKAGNGAPNFLEFDYPYYEGLGVVYPNTHPNLSWSRHVWK